jgi:RHS repeat-associated protein
VANNGNVARITNHRDTARSQRFTYDALNRIQTAQTAATYATHPSKCWAETFTYDVWANLLSIAGIQPEYTGCAQENLGVGVNTKNQISSAGFVHDAAGNLTSTPNPGGLTMTYDAENHLTSVAGVTYTYDGDGRRVMKSSAGTPPQPFKLYWYGTSPDALVETDAAGGNATEYIFFNGRRIARREPSGSVFYYLADHLGSSRVVTNSTGTVVEESDYHPFGGERVLTDSLPNQNYKFTGKERDPESSLDYFGARFFASTLGRFQSPDPLLNSGRPWNPQTWNRYAYTLNNPLNFIDPMGLYEWAANTCARDDKKCNKQYMKNQQKFRDSLTNLKKARDKYKPGSKEYNRLDAALKAYGKEGEKNGVFVAFGKLKDDTAADLQTRADEQGKLSFTVTFDMSKISGSNEFAVATGHEGTHISDSLQPFRNSLSDFSFEYRAYQTSVWTAQGLGIANYSLKAGDRTYEIWNSSWGKVDRQTKPDSGITRFLVEHRRFPETIPHNPVPDN